MAQEHTHEPNKHPLDAEDNIDDAAYWTLAAQRCEDAASIQLKRLEEEQRVAKIEEERAMLDAVVFNLSRAFENPPTATFIDYSELLDRNARILNAGFEYYLDKAVDSPKADQKIRLAIQMQGQLVRTVDAWRRLEKFLEDKTK